MCLRLRPCLSAAQAYLADALLQLRWRLVCCLHGLDCLKYTMSNSYAFVAPTPAVAHSSAVTVCSAGGQPRPTCNLSSAMQPKSRTVRRLIPVAASQACDRPLVSNKQQHWFELVCCSSTRCCKCCTVQAGHIQKLLAISTLTQVYTSFRRFRDGSEHVTSCETYSYAG
jgi:hypothetical protein